MSEKEEATYAGTNDCNQYNTEDKRCRRGAPCRNGFLLARHRRNCSLLLGKAHRRQWRVLDDLPQPTDQKVSAASGRRERSGRTQVRGWPLSVRVRPSSLKRDCDRRARMPLETAW
jgi:hypothetical protein